MARGSSSALAARKDPNSFSATCPDSTRQPLPGTETATRPFFSADGQWIGFWRAEDRILRKVSHAGGSPLEIAPTDVPHIGAVGGGRRDRDRYRVAKRGTVVDPGQAEDTPANPRPRSPLRASGFRCARWSRAATTCWWRASDPGVPGSTCCPVKPESDGDCCEAAATSWRAYTTGHLVYTEADALFAVPLDERFGPVGTPAPVMHGIDHHFWHSNVALSENGTVVYVPAERVRDAELAWLDRQGNITSCPWRTSVVLTVALSPDGREAAARRRRRNENAGLDLRPGTGNEAAARPEGDSRPPIWSRDGAFMTYVSTRGDAEAIYRKRADGTGAEELLARRSRSADPRRLVSGRPNAPLQRVHSRGDSDIWIYSAGKARHSLPVPSARRLRGFLPMAGSSPSRQTTGASAMSTSSRFRDLVLGPPYPQRRLPSLNGWPKGENSST